MANERLNYKIDADASGFERGVNNAEKATKKLSGSTKRSGQAFTQLAYALDDAQYGFRGVQNNIQAIAVSAGAGGPLVLAITAATVAIGYLIENFDFLKESIEDVRKEYKKFGEDLVTHLGAEAAVQKKLAEEQDALAKSYRNQKFIPNRQGNLPTKAEVSLYESLAQAAEKQAKEHRDIAKVLGEQQAKLIEANAKEWVREQNADKLKKKTNEQNKELEEQLRLAEQIDSILNKDTFFVDQELVDYSSKLFGEGGQFADPGEQDALFIDLGEQDALDELHSFLDEYNKATEEAEQYGDRISNSFDDLANNIANSLAATQGPMGAFLGTIAQALVKYLGEYIAFAAAKSKVDATVAGTSAVAGATQAAAATGPAFPATLPLFLAAGLAAVSAAMSGVGGKSISGGGGSRSQRVGNFTPHVGISQTFGSGNRVIGELELRGQNLVVGIQAATETRQTF